VVKIGSRLKELRLQKFLTQVELAERAGISQRAITQIERDRVEPHITTMRKLAAALGVEPQELMRGSDE
jgi:transcriptional regulator with XRE-family HTH domain